MIKKFKFAFLIIILPVSIYGHYNWITAESHYGGRGEEVRLHIGCGHDFPESDLALSERLIKGVNVILPCGGLKTLDIKTDSKSKSLLSVLKLESTGTYTVSYQLQRPQMESPVACGSTVIICEKYSDFNLNGKAAEIAPVNKEFSLRKKETVQLGVFNSGERGGGILRVYPPVGRSYRIRTTQSRPAEIKADVAGEYLVTSRAEGIDISFTFSIPGIKNESD